MNKTSQYTFTILVPFYNEEDNIYNLEKAFADNKNDLEKAIKKAIIEKYE